MEGYLTIESAHIAAIQDSGRLGYEHYGICDNGAVDMYAYLAENALVGNAAAQPSIEITAFDFTMMSTVDIPVARQLELNVMEPVLVFNLLQSIMIMKNVFQSFTKNCLVGIEPYEDTMKSYVEKSVGIVTAISPSLGYETSSKLAREALLSEKSVRQLCLDHHVLTREQLDIILDPFEMTKPGISGEKRLGYDTSKV